MWGATVFIVPLRIGGGTRLKIYEAMAAGVPVVSTTIGAEGLDVQHPETIRLADTAEAFAEQCLELLNPRNSQPYVSSARELASRRFRWEQVASEFSGSFLALNPPAPNVIRLIPPSSATSRPAGQCGDRR
jgi:glycosyltransferase involved in cell wall biosynthesis